MRRYQGFSETPQLVGYPVDCQMFVTMLFSTDLPVNCRFENMSV